MTFVEVRVSSDNPVPPEVGHVTKPPATIAPRETITAHHQTRGNAISITDMEKTVKSEFIANGTVFLPEK